MLIFPIWQPIYHVARPILDLSKCRNAESTKLWKERRSVREPSTVGPGAILVGIVMNDANVIFMSISQTSIERWIQFKVPS
jgi:hypothetical protein